MKMHEHIRKKLRLAQIRSSVFYERVIRPTHVFKDKPKERKSIFLFNVVDRYTAFIRKLLRRNNNLARYPGLTLEFLRRSPGVSILQQLLVQRVFHAPISHAPYRLTKLTINYFNPVQIHQSFPWIAPRLAGVEHEAARETTTNRGFRSHYFRLRMENRSVSHLTAQKSSLYQLKQGEHVAGREHVLNWNDSHPNARLRMATSDHQFSSYSPKTAQTMDTTRWRAGHLSVPSAFSREIVDRRRNENPRLFHRVPGLIRDLSPAAPLYRERSLLGGSEGNYRISRLGSGLIARFDNEVDAGSFRRPSFVYANQSDSDGLYNVGSQILSVTSSASEIAAQLIKNPTNKNIQAGSPIQRLITRRRVNEDLAPAAAVLKHARHAANIIARRLLPPHQWTGQGKKERVGRWADEPKLRHRQPTNMVNNAEKDQTATLNSPAGASLKAVIPQGITERGERRQAA